MRISSRVPASPSARASARIDSSLRLRNAPRRLRDDAERARMIATLRDFEVRGRAWRGYEPGKKIVLGLGLETEAHRTPAGAHVVE